MGNRFWSPLHLSDTIGPLNVIGDDLTVNPQKLLNPNRGPMLIDQFRLSGIPVSSGNSEILWGLLGVIGIEIRLGAVPLMGKPVTVGSFFPRFRGAFSGPYQQVSLGGSPVYNPVVTDEPVLVRHLHKPLFVPTNVQLTVRLIRQRLFAPGTLSELTDQLPSLRFSVVGRSLPENEPSPERIWVPWASETKAQVAAPTFDSPDSDLINSHDVPLAVKEFIGYETITANSNTSGTHQGDLNVRMTASNGTTIVREPTPFGFLFPYDRGVLPVDAMLQPGEYVRVGLDARAPTGAAAADASVQFTSITMMGYRQVPTPKANKR